MRGTITPGMPAAPARRGDFDARQTMTVGRDGAQHRVPLDVDRVHENAVEIIARLLVGDGELRLVDQPLEIGRGEREPVAKLAGGEIGKIAVRQGLQMKRERPERSCSWPFRRSFPATPARRRAACG